MARGSNPLSVESRSNRSYLLYGFSIVVMVIIGVSMIGTLAPSGVGGNGSAIVFGTYDGQELSYSPTNFFGASYDRFYRDYSAQAAEDTDPRALLSNVWSNAYRATVLHTAQVHLAVAAGVHVSQQRVDQTLIESVARYEDLEQMPVATREGNLERLHELLLRQRYRDDLTSGRLSSESEIAFYEEMIRHERRFEFVSLSYGAYPDEEVAAYAADSAGDFRRVGLSRIQIRGEAEAAEAIRQRIVSGTATFEDQARAHSQDGFRESGGDMGLRYFFDVSRAFDDPETANQVFALGEGEVSPVLAGRSEDVYYLYRADSRVIEPDFSDADTLATVRAYLVTFERGRVEDYLLAQADRFAVAASQTDFRTAATDLGLTVHATEWFPINFRNSVSPRAVRAAGDLPLLSDAEMFEDFFQQGFALQRIGDVSAPVRLTDQVIVLSLLEERELPQDDLRNEVLGETVFGWFTERAMNDDLVWWVNNSGLLEDNFAQAFAVITGGG